MKNYMATVGRLIHQSGYHVIPIQPNTKKPGQWRPEGWSGMNDWSRFCRERPADGTVHMWSQWPGCGVGVACGRVVAIDIDILDPNVADDVEIAIQQYLGKTTLKRVGKAPKLLLVYQTDEPFPKLRRGPIEALCDGQQFVAYSIHPDTGVEYEWPEDNLFDVPLGMVPRVSRDRVETALNIAYELLPEELRMKGPREVYSASAASSPETSDRGLTAHQDAILSALEALQNPDLHWDSWNKIGMALFAASNGAAWAHEAWHAFSSKAAKNDPAETDARWSSFHRSRPVSVGAGTLFLLAKQDGWEPPTSLDYQQGYVDTSDISEEVVAMAAGALTVISGGLDEPVEPEPELPEVLPPEGFAKPDGKFPYSQWFEEDRGPVSQVANWIVGTAPRPHPELALANTLAMFGTIFGRNYKMARYGTRSNVLLVGVAPTGSGKEYSRACVKRLMKAADMLKHVGGDDIKSGSAVETMLTENPSRLNMLDEMGLYLQGIFHKDAQGYKKEIGRKMLEFYSASTSVYMGSQYADPKSKPAVVIHNPIWCVYGTTTMETLRPVLQQSTQQDGTLPRILFFDANKRPAQRFDVDTTQDPPQGIVEFLQSLAATMPSLVGDLGAVNVSTEPAQSNVVEWSEDAFEMFKAMSVWCDELMEKRGTVWTRAMENTIKIAMIDAISTTDLFKPVVRPKSLQKAFNLVYWANTFLESAIQNEGAENETEAVQKRVWRIISDHAGEEGLSGDLLARKTQFLKKRDRIDVIDSLVDAKRIKVVKVATGKPGQPPVRYFPA